MITLTQTNTIQGIAGTGTAITYFIDGAEMISNVQNYKILAQGQLPTSVGVLYTVPSSTNAFIKNITLVNTTSTDVTGVILYINGSTAAYQIIPSSIIVANGKAIFDGTGWKYYDADGALLIANSTRDIDGLIIAKQGSFWLVGNAAGGLLTTGLAGTVVIPYGYTIRKWSVSSSVAQSIVIDIKKSGVSLVGTGNKPTLSSSQFSEANVSGWTTVVGSAYDTLTFHIDSTTTGDVICIIYLTKN